MLVTFIGMSPQVYHYFQEHTHSEWEITLNLQGEGYVMIGQKRYDYSPGTILCCPPNVPHIKFSENGFRDIFLLPSVFPLSKAMIEKDHLLFQDDSEKSFESLMLMALRTFHKKESNYSSLVDSLYEAMNQLFIGWMHGASEEKMIEQLKNAIAKSFTDPELTVSQLLEGRPYCADHLRRRFKSVTGQTPLEYLTRLRLEYSKKLMCENSILHYSIAEIGAMSGFYDCHYFSKIFKKHTGMTPSEYLHDISQV